MKSARMSFFNKLRGFRLLMAALVVFMSGMTVAEAAECANETQSVEFTLAADASHNSDNVPAQDDGSDHGICPHGHCHNVSHSVVANSESEIANEVRGSFLKFNNDLIARSRYLSGLKRPPRA